MRDKSGTDFWWEEHLSFSMKFINDEISYDHFIRYHKETSAKHHYAIEPLKAKGMYSILLKKLRVKDRLPFIVDAVNTGLTIAELELVLGINSKQITNFYLAKNKTSAVDPSFIEMLSVICRVPSHWMFRGEVLEIWDNENLLYINNVDYNLISFMELLSKVNNRDHLVKAVRLNIGKYCYRMRVEMRYGSLFFELLHEVLEPNEYQVIKNVLIPLGCCTGKFKTVFTDRVHHGFFSPFRSKKIICLPVEFYSDTAN